MDMVRCFTCGRVLKWERMRRLTDTMTPEDAMNAMGYTRYCCRSHLAFSSNPTERALDVHDRVMAALRQADGHYVFAETPTDKPRTYAAV